MAPEKDIFMAISTKDDHTVQKLLEQDPNQAKATNDKGLSSVIWALYHHRPDLAERIASFRETLNPFEATALGHLATLRKQINANAEILNDISSDGFSLLHYACFFSQFAIAKWLIKKGADIQAMTPEPALLRPIHSAVAAKATPIVQLLLAAGADANVQQQGGFTPLMGAAIHGELEIMEALIRHGAKVHACNDMGQTAKQIAEEKDQKAAIDLLDSNSSIQ